MHLSACNNRPRFLTELLKQGASVDLQDSLGQTALMYAASYNRLHIVAGLAIYARSTMAQTGVSGPVVVDGESFLDALFASAGQG